MTTTPRALAPLAGLALLAFALAAPAPAEAAPKLDPTGYWLTVDDDGKLPRSIVHIKKDAQGKLVGEVVKLFRKPDENPNPLCDECDEGFKGANIKGKPALGLTILWDVVYDEDEEWDDGEILDPGNGKTYSVELEVQNGGQKLKVRGYLGVSLLGRTQHWHRTKKPEDTLQILKPGDTWKSLR